MADKLPEGCDNSIDANMGLGRTINIVPEPNRRMLTDKQVVDYYSYRERFLRWLLDMGKASEEVKGYAPYTVYETGYRVDTLERWVWDGQE